MTAFERLIAALEAHGATVKPTGTRKAMAQCPAHEDRTPSLAVTAIEGSVLLKCWASCELEDVLAALGLAKRDLYDEPRPRRLAGVAAHAVYAYDNGRQVIRSADKEFRQANTDRPPELYRLAKIRAAVAEGRPVYVVEGEKDVHALEAIGATATTSPMGAGNWDKVDPSPLYGGTLVVVADQDDPGREHAVQVVASLRGRAAVSVVSPKAGKDAADHIAAGYGVEDFVAQPDLVLDENLPSADGDPGQSGISTDDSGGGRKSAATVLVELALARYRFGVSTDGEAFAVPLEGDPVARLLRGGKRGLRAELARAYFEAHGKAAPQQALADALLVIEGRAKAGEAETLAQRVARTDAAWWLDLGTTTGDAVRIDGTGWTVTAPAVRFRRTALTAALPAPARGGTLDDLWQVLNVAPADRPLVAAWLVAALVADIPHPILNLEGEQGTGKSTAARIITSLVDPSPVPLRKAPRDPDSWITAASGSWVVAIDNVSTISDWLSDSLCRAVTGDGDVRRQLYTDAGLALFAFRRALLLNGIDLGAVRGDLADRLLVVSLDVIGDESRLLDADIEQHWRDVHPRVFGALLDLAAGVAGVLPSVRLERSPRMADFARVLAAVDRVLGTDGLRRYVDRARNLATDALTADPFVVEMARQLPETFVGTSAELLAQIALDERAPKGWPANARQLTTLLKRQAPVMRRAGWHVDEDIAPHDKVLRWTIRPPEIARNEHPQHPQPPQPPETSVLQQPTAAGVDATGHPQADPQPPPTPAASTVATPTITGLAGVAGVAGDGYRQSQDDERTPAQQLGNPRCTVCGEANLFAPASIERGICAACVRVAEAAS